MKINCEANYGETRHGIISYTCETSDGPDGTATFMTELPQIIILGLILLIFCMLLFVSVRILELLEIKNK